MEIVSRKLQFPDLDLRQRMAGGVRNVGHAKLLL